VGARTDSAATLTRPVCLVTGATGAIGPGVVNALADTFEIRTLTRRPPEPALFDVPVTPFTGDVSDLAVVRRAAESASVIVHLAALLHIVAPPASLRAEYERINIEGTRAVIEAAGLEAVSRVVFLSTIGVYGYTSQPVLDEDSPTRPTTFYGETKLAAERIVLGARAGDGGALSTVLRSAAVYGPRVKGNYQRLLRALARHRFVPIGPGDNLRTLVFEDDLASATALAAQHAAAAGRIYNVSDGKLHALRDVIHAICVALGRPTPRLHVPIAPISAILRAASVLDRGLPAMLAKYLEEVAVDASRIQTELGFRPQVDLLGGWTATVAALRRSGDL
jgi:nucleoside-diphosphate-sugar epimerase